METVVAAPPTAFNVPPPSIPSMRGASLQQSTAPPRFSLNQPPFGDKNSGIVDYGSLPSTTAMSYGGGGGGGAINHQNVSEAADGASMDMGMGNSAYPSKSYRFKSRMTVNLAEMEGYGRRLRRNLSQVRRHIDSVASLLTYVENRIWQSERLRDRPTLQPHFLYSCDSMPPHSTLDKPIDCVTTKFVRAAMNKVKCPVYDICWTPEGRRLITGASSGEFTLWNGTAFNFETILQAHDTAVRALKWSHSDLWMISADHDGFIKYWQANMNNVTMFLAHKEAVRSVSFCPTDVKFATASDDGTVRVWDFMHCHEERIFRGHGSDVRSVDWHPRKALLVSGSRDSQQPVKLWDAKTGQCLATLHDHKNAVMSVQWNENGNWLITGSRDHLVKLYDIRMMKEIMSFRGHKKEVTSLAWHPVHEALFVSGGADGALMFWSVNNDKEVGIIENAHEQAIWALKWHPLGHILASGSNDNNTKFWTRNKPGDTLEDFYFVAAYPYDQQQRTQQAQTTAANHSTDRANLAEPVTPTSKPKVEPKVPMAIPGMGLDAEMFDKLREQQQQQPQQQQTTPTTPALDAGGIPGLGGVTESDSGAGGRKTLLKQPPPKKAQRQFERVWNVNSRLQGAMLGPADEGGPPTAEMEYRKPKPSLLGAPPPIMDAPTPGSSATLQASPQTQQQPPPPPQQQQQQPQQQQSQQQQQPQSWFDQTSMNSNSVDWQQSFGQQTLSGSSSSRTQSFLPGISDILEQQNSSQWMFSERGDVDLRQMSSAAVWSSSGPQLEDVDYRELSAQQAQSQPTSRDPRMQPRSAPQQQPSSDYQFHNWMDSDPSNQQYDRQQRRQIQQQQQQKMMVDGAATIGGGPGSGARSRSDDQDSEASDGGGRSAPTNPKRKWKQEYEAEEAQGTRRWAIGEDEPSPTHVHPVTGDKDERLPWAKSSRR